MGEQVAAFVNDLHFPLAEQLPVESTGTIQRFTPTIEALVTTAVDESLDGQAEKTQFWNAFKALGPWWAEQPPY